MSNIKLDTKDVMPVVIIVLNYISCDIDTSIVKLALNNQYAHLKGSIDPEEFTQEIHDMSKALDDPLSVILRSFSEKVMDCYYNLAITYTLVLEEILGDERLVQLAGDVYEARSEYTYEVKTYSAWNLDIYFFSLPAVIEQLRQLILTEEFDADEMGYVAGLCPEYFEQFKNDGGTNENLTDIALSIYTCHDRIYPMLGLP
jgi:hypothetical protein